MKVYIAGKYESRARLREESHAIQVKGHRMLSTWMNETATREEGLEIPDYALLAAKRDVEEVTDADLFIVDTFDVSTTGGRHVEMGLALASGVPVWVVGPLGGNIFHTLASRTFASWHEVHRSIKVATLRTEARA